MTTVVFSDEGQIPLPTDLRRRLGLGAGARLELSEEPDGLRLRVLRAHPPTDIANLAGIIKAPSRGAPCRLEDFDPASLFVTFDRRLAKRAKMLGCFPAVELLK